MDSSEHQSVSNLPLNRLAAHALCELEKLRYSRRSVRRYRRVWEHLVRFARQMNLGDEYSEHLAARFVDAHLWSAIIPVEGVRVADGCGAAPNLA